jgi:hypothetical protein
LQNFSFSGFFRMMVGMVFGSILTVENIEQIGWKILQKIY